MTRPVWDCKQPTSLSGNLFHKRNGLLDDLEMEYDGNRLVKTYDYTPENDPTYEGAMQFTDNGNQAVEYGYDENRWVLPKHK